MNLGLKIALGIGGVGTVAGTGVAISSIYGGESIKEHIEKTNKKSNKVFLTSNNSELTEIKKKYTASKNTTTRPKPKDKNGEEVKEDKLAKWCEEAINEKFTDENSDIYKGIMSWCYINTNSFEKEFGKEISKKAEGDAVWKTAWTKYSSAKSKLTIKIKILNLVQN